MKRLLSALLFGGLCFGQILTLAVAPSPVSIGQSATLTLQYADSASGANMAGLQWLVTLPAGVTGGTPLNGAAATAAGKVITCGAVGCLLIGNGSTVNNSVIASGTLATIPLSVGTGATLGAASVTATALGVTATNPSTITLTVNPATFTIAPSIYDLNGDGVVNSQDLSIIIQQFVGKTCTGPSAQVGDGKCDLVDVAIEIHAVLGIP